MKRVHFVETPPDSSNPESPTLAIHPELLQPRYIDYDFSAGPSSITITGSSKNRRLLSEPATSPSLSFLSINCPYIPWKIEVLNSTHSYVTVEDVLEGIYRCLRTNVTQAEWEITATSPQSRAHAAAAYERRWRRIAEPTMQVAERNKGLKRVDFLGYRCGFNGLSCRYRNGNLVFTLHLRTIAPLPRLRKQESIDDVSPSYEPSADSRHSEPVVSNESGPGQLRDYREMNTLQAQTPRLHIPPQPDKNSLEEQDFAARNNDGDRDMFLDQVAGDERTLHSSMFEQAHDFTISGGQFYSAPGGTITVDSSQDASNHVMTVNNLWHINHGSNHIAVAPAVPSHIGGASNQPGTLSREKEPFPIAASTPSHESSSQANQECPSNNSDTVCSSPEDEVPTCVKFVCDLEQLNDLEERSTLLATHNSQEGLSEHVQSSSIRTSSDHPLEYTILIDDIIFDTLSRYPASPRGSDVQSVHRIISALLYSFSPLSVGVLATLIKFDNEQQVMALLLPLSPFIIVPDSNAVSESVGFSNDEEHSLHTQAPIRFVDASVTGFFLDRMRSGQYYADAFVGHRALLDACTWVMARVHKMGPRRENEFETLTRPGRWREAYEYSCRNWERHLLVGNQCRRRIGSKL